MRCGFVFGAWVALYGAAANAQLVSRDDAVFGPDSITFDGNTGLEWLDVTESTGRTYNDITGVDGSDELAAGGDFEGFQHGTATDVAEFFLSGGVADGQPADAGRFAPVRALQGLVGETFTGDIITTNAFTSTPSAPGSHFQASLFADTLNQTAFADTTNAGVSDNGASPVRGHWLFRVVNRVDDTGLVFAHDFETIGGATVFPLVGPNATKTANLGPNGTDPLQGSSQHLRAPTGSTIARVLTQARLTAPADGLSFSFFYNDRGDAVQQARLLSTYDGTGAVGAAELVFDVNTQGQLRLIANAETVVSTANVPAQSGVWQQVGFVFDGGDVTFFLDGAPLGNVVSFPVTTQIPAQNLDWTLVEDADVLSLTGEYFEGGDYDEAALFTRALFPAEMGLLVSDGLATTVPEPGALALGCAALAALARRARRPRRTG